MDFKRLTLECIDVIRPYFTHNENRLCDCTAGGTFIWRDYHKTEYAIDNGDLYLKVAYPEPAFTPPRGKEPDKESYRRIIDYCVANNMKARLCVVSEPTLNRILELFPNAAARTDRDWSDYLYLSSDIVNLAGRKYSGQRNHINRFMREHTSWSFERITNDKAPEVKVFFNEYADEHIKDDSPAYVEGNKKALEVLDNPDAYGLLGGVLYVGGQVAGASFGEIVGDTLFVHTEKADTAYHGSYPMLVNQFARMFVTEGIEYVNREEDDGVEGLRTSKLSYHPVQLLHKYTVEID